MNDNLNINKIKSIFVAYISNAFDNHYEELLNETEDSDKSFEREALIYEIATEQLTEFYDDNLELPEKDELINWAEELYGSYVDSELKSDEDIEKLNKVVDNISENFNELFDSALKNLLEGDQGWLENIDSNDFKKIIDETKHEIKNLFNREWPLGE